MRRKWIVRVAVGLSSVLLIGVALTVFLIWSEGQRTPDGSPVYVALGSSYAAGVGLGPRQSESPVLCGRSINGYPQQLARKRGLPIVDMTCAGAVTRNVLHGGQYFQGPQLRVISDATRLVTLTVGGNDIGYVGDLSMLAARSTSTLYGRLVRLFWAGPKTPAERHYRELYGDLVQTLRAIHARGPHAAVVVVTYPTLLPPTGTCSALGISKSDAQTMRGVGEELAAVSRSAAATAGAIVIDMQTLGLQHNACSPVPWTAGRTDAALAPFHPTLLGAKATADAISAALGVRR